MRKGICTIIVALLACAWLSVLPAQAVPAPNPETFQTYPVGVWSPTFAVEGWQDGGGWSSNLQIIDDPTQAGNHVMHIGYRSATRSCTLDKTLYPQQVYSEDFRLEELGDPHYSRYMFGMSDGVVALTDVDIYYNGTIQRANFYYGGGSVNMPGWASITLDTWYTLQIEIDYATNMQRARFGPRGGTFNAWTDWLPVENVCQPTMETHGASGNGSDASWVDVDNVSLVGKPVPAPNPETFESYSLGTPWTPTLADNGWLSYGGWGPNNLGIVDDPTEAGNKVMHIGYRNADRNYSLDKTVYTKQTYSLDFRLEELGDPHHSRYAFSAGNGTLALFDVDIYYSAGAIQRAKLYYGGGSVNMPGWEAIALDRWYSLQVQIDYTTNKERACFGQRGGGYNAWTDWFALENVIQPDRDSHYGGGNQEDGSWVFVDNVSLETTGAGAGNLNVNVTLGDYSGPLGLVKAKIDVLNGGVVAATATVDAPAGNPFTTSFTNLPAVAYTVRIETPKWLTQTVSATVLEGQTVSANITLPNGDFDGDNVITSTDVSVALKNMDMVGN